MRIERLIFPGRTYASRRWLVAAVAMLAIALSSCTSEVSKETVENPGTSEAAATTEDVVFWHFWGGKDSAVVESIINQFNASQSHYRVRAVAMPGNNLQAKLFLAVAGGDPPDLVNQDDPVLADWANRGVIMRFGDFVDDEEIELVRSQLFPAALRLSSVDGRLCGLCNGLDIRALYYNATALKRSGLPVPTTLGQLDAIAEHFAAPGLTRLPQTVGYLPDTRRLWAWGPVFGGEFYDWQSQTATINHPGNVAALKWIRSYQNRYGADNLASFRQADQSLPGKTFPLLPVSDDADVGRYVMLMDGQWRVRDIDAFGNRRQRLGLATPEFGVCALPFPDADRDGVGDHGARKDAGWVNGNFFVVPTGANCPRGAWEFAKFWIGINNAPSAAQWYVEGGWIPATERVVRTKTFQDYLDATPLFKQFVGLAGSTNQFPVPAVSGAAALKRSVESLGYDALMVPMTDEQLQQRLRQCQREVDSYLRGKP